MTDPIHRIQLDYTEAATGAHVLKFFTLDKATLHLAQLWKAQQKTPPTAKRFSDWLHDNGGKLDRANGPAITTTFSGDLNRVEQWFRNNQLHRKKDPAVIIYYSNGYRLKEWYNKGKFIKEERTASPPGGADLSTIPGVTLLPSSPKP